MGIIGRTYKTEFQGSRELMVVDKELDHLVSELNGLLAAAGLQQNGTFSNITTNALTINPTITVNNNTTTNSTVTSATGTPTIITGASGAAAKVAGITIDGAGSVITTGVKGYLYIPTAGTITSVSLLADQVGSIVIDVWKDDYNNFPPTSADNIAPTTNGCTPPTLSSAQKSLDWTLTNWDTALAQDDVLAFNVTSVSTVTRVTLQLMVQV